MRSTRRETCATTASRSDGVHVLGVLGLDPAEAIDEDGVEVGEEVVDWVGRRGLRRGERVGGRRGIDEEGERHAHGRDQQDQRKVRSAHGGKMAHRRNRRPRIG